MTSDEQIKQWAALANIGSFDGVEYEPASIGELRRFAELAQEAEREECAQACRVVAHEAEAEEFHADPDEMAPSSTGAWQCVSAIRARGEKQ